MTRTLPFLISLIFLKLALIFVYDEVMVVSYGYYGFKSLTVSLQSSIFNWTMFLLCSLNLAVLVKKEIAA